MSVDVVEWQSNVLKDGCFKEESGRAVWKVFEAGDQPKAAGRLEAEALAEPCTGSGYPPLRR